MADPNTGKEYSAAAVNQQYEDLQAEERKNLRVGQKEPLATLVAEVSGGDEIFVTKAQDLARRYTSMRRVRRDGSCFIRAYLYAIAEEAARDPAAAATVLKKVEALKAPLLARLGEHFEDFHDVLHELFTDIKEGKVGPDTTPSLHDKFQGGEADYAAYYCRFAASHYLQENAILFEPFLDIDVPTYCKTAIETVGSEFEQVSIIALTNVFEVPVLIQYFDLSPGTACNSHRFPEEGDVKAVLLYRPGHYDMLYA